MLGTEENDSSTLGKRCQVDFEAVALIFKCKDFFYFVKRFGCPFFPVIVYICLSSFN